MLLATGPDARITPLGIMIVSFQVLKFAVLTLIRAVIPTIASLSVVIFDTESVRNWTTKFRTISG